MNEMNEIERLKKLREFTNEEFEMAKKCFYIDSWECVHDCPYNDGQCNDFVTKYGGLPSAAYVREVLNEE